MPCGRHFVDSPFWSGERATLTLGCGQRALFGGEDRRDKAALVENSNAGVGAIDTALAETSSSARAARIRGAANWV